MRRTYTLWLTLLTLLFVPVTTAWGQLNSYYFAHSTGDPTPMDNANVLFAGQQFYSEDDGLYFIDIGFPFRFDGNEYDFLTISTNGVVYFGFNFSSDWSNGVQSATSYPCIFPYWDDLRLTGGAFCVTPTLSYQVTGDAPNRVLTIQWEEISLPGFTPFNMPIGTFQLRMYETSNKVEFWYGTMSNCDVCGLSGDCFSTSASVGIASDPGSFISVSFDGGPHESRDTPDDYVDISTTPIEENTLIVFGECFGVLNGRIGPNNGGTATMQSGDTFFEGMTTQIGESSVYRPFDIRMVSSSCSGTYTLTIDGPAASDYYFGTPGTQEFTGNLVGSQVDIPEITFEPTDAGVREADLIISGLGGTKYLFHLAAYAPHVNYIGHVADGGTPKMQSGDVLLVGKRINRHENANYSPFSLINVSTNSVPVEYTITGGFGQYTISPGVTLGPGETTTPVINFNALGFGVVNAQLQVNAGGEIRTFTLAATSAAPGGEFRLGSALLDTGSTLFTNTYVCVGDQVQSLKVDMVNTGYGAFTITGAQFFEVDTMVQQGIPKYAFRRDSHGYLIPSNDYVVSLQPPVPGSSGSANVFPITLSEGQSQSIYITFMGTTTGKRYARGYIYTNSQNTAAPDTLGVVHEGIVAFDVFGRGSGARLAGDLTGRLPKTVVFPGARLGSSSQAVMRLMNPGACTLRVSMDKLQIVAGDVDEFSILSKPTGHIHAPSGDLVLAPGESDSLVLSFSPLQAGSRRASLRLVTNDSTIHLPNIAERGVYYVDLYGSGGTDIYTQGIDFGQALIGGTGAEQRRDVVRIVNTMNVALTVNSMAIEGPDKDDFKQDTPWPLVPFVLQPGDEVEVGVKFAPQAMPTGPRSAQLKLMTSHNLEGVAELKGFAGTRTMDVTPGTIVFTAMSTQKQQRRMVTITNTGTMPIHLTTPEVPGPESANFKLSTLTRTEIPAGGSEYLEVTYAPTIPGPVNATLSIGSDATNSPALIIMSGTAFIPRGNNGDGNTPVTGIENGVGRPTDLSTSDIDAVTTVEGITLYQSRPNPAQELAEIRYSLVKSTNVQLALYDAKGQLVRVLENGMRGSGEQSVRVDVRELPSGTYFYRLTANGQTLNRTMTVAR